MGQTKNLLKNGDFEDSTTSIVPWIADASPGFANVVTPAQGQEAQHGSNFFQLISSNIAYSMGNLVPQVKQSHIYNLSYYAYAYDNGGLVADRAMNWTVQLGPKTESIVTDTQQGTFTKSQTLDPSQWPFWSHAFNATGDRLAVVFVQQNATVLNLDNVQLVCSSCPAENHVGAIVGGVIGGIAGVGLLVLLAAWFWIKKGRDKWANRGRRAPSRSYDGSSEKGGVGGFPSSGRPTTSSPGTFGTSTMASGASLLRRGTPGGQSLFSQEVHTDLNKPDVYPLYDAQRLAHLAPGRERSPPGGSSLAHEPPDRTASGASGGGGGHGQQQSLGM